MRDQAPAAAILSWYDQNARVMPWRVSPQDRAAGIRPDPYHVWMSEIMLQQTTVAAVRDYFRKFIDIWPTVEALAAARDGDVMAAWAGLGYYARARNLLKCARVVTEEHGGQFPETQEALQKLPGIGGYTSAAIASIAFDAPAAVLDGNVERVMSRLHNDPTPLPRAKPLFLQYAQTMTPDERPGDYAQAVMDLGATICTPRKPACMMCPWADWCDARAAGTQLDLPVKQKKKPQPRWFGYAYVARREDGAWLLETRPDDGLLGGMLGWPGSDWSESPAGQPPCDGDWQDLRGTVRHTFTHFKLQLTVRVCTVPMGTDTTAGQFIPKDQFSPADLPTVMRKVFDRARSHFT